MARHPFNLPAQLKQESEKLAAAQGVSLNQFVMWAVAEKVGMLKASPDDPRFLHITYRRGASGTPAAVVRETGIRVSTLILASQMWGLSVQELAQDYDLSPVAVMNHVQLATLAVSLGNVDTLIEHPASMTHAGAPPEERRKVGITDGLVRLSVGIENVGDLMADLDRAMGFVA